MGTNSEGGGRGHLFFVLKNKHLVFNSFTVAMTECITARQILILNVYNKKCRETANEFKQTHNITIKRPSTESICSQWYSFAPVFQRFC